MAEAYKRVVKNGGASGIDGMTVQAMYGHLKEHYPELIQSLYDGSYRPQAVKRVEIPKADGGKRKLGIPTVIDRMIQQAISQVLTPIFEKQFSDGSYGFRKGRSAHQAIEQARIYYEQGYKVSVDIDLAKYFDTVNHNLLIKMLREEIKDERVIRLVRKYLKSGVIENGLMTIPVFAIEIPLIGSLANIIGIFLGAVVAGIAGAFVLNLLDKLIAEKQKKLITEKQIVLKISMICGVI